MPYVGGRNTETGERIEDLFSEKQEEQLDTSNNEQECIAFANFLMEETKTEIAGERNPDLIAVLSSEARNWASMSLIFKSPDA